MMCHFHPGYGKSPHGPTGQGKALGQHGVQLIIADNVFCVSCYP